MKTIIKPEVNMPFNIPEVQQQFNSLIELIKQNKPTDIEFYKQQYANGKQIKRPKEWQETKDGGPMLVARKISQQFAVFGPDLFYYKWKNSNGLIDILTPAFNETGPVGLTITIPRETSSEDLALLFAAIEQNNNFADKVLEMDFIYCTNLTQRIVFPKNLARLQKLNMERISTTFVCENYDDLGPKVLFGSAKMGAPDLSSMPSLTRVSFAHTHLKEWPILPKSLEDYVQYGDFPMSIMRLNLSSKALPNLKRAFFEGGCCNSLSIAYAICLLRMLHRRTDLKVNFSECMYQLTDQKYEYNTDIRTIKLTTELLDEHFNKIVQNSSYANCKLVTENELRQCASILYDMLVDARDIEAQAVVSSYIDTRLPVVIAQVEETRIQRAQRDKEENGLAQASSLRQVNRF